MKLSHENKFGGWIARIKKAISEFDINTCLGNIKTYLTTPYYELYADEFEGDLDEESLEQQLEVGIYHFEAKEASEYPFVVKGASAGYAVIVSLGDLSEADRLGFVRNLKMELFKLGIPTYPVSEECIIAAPPGVEVVDFETKTQQPKGKIIQLSDQRRKKY